MARFAYKVQDKQERLVTGTIEGATIDEAMEKLALREYTPLSIEEVHFDGSRKDAGFLEKLQEGFKKRQEKVADRDVVFFTRQLATMIEAGVPLTKALDRLGQSEKPVFKKIIMDLEEEISKGNTFSDALSKHPGAFNNMFVSVVRSGEVSGALDRVLDQMAIYQERMATIRQKIKGAMRYPMFITGFVTLMMIGIMWKLVPVFESMYGGFAAQLPLPTQILITGSHLVRERLLLVLLALVGLVVLFKVAMSYSQVKVIVHQVLFRLPVYGLLFKKNIWAGFSRTLSLLMESGNPILQAVEVTAAAVDNPVFSEKLGDVYQQLQQGELLSQSLAETGMFSPLMIQLISTGEESGKIDELLRKSADFYETEIKVTVDSMAAIIEPVLIIFLGGLVGGIIIALYLPIFSMGKLMS